MTSYREGDVYLTIRPGRYPFDLIVDKATNSEPRKTSEGSVVVKVKVRIPKAAFKPIQPTAILTIPEDLIQHPVEVEAVEQ